MAIRLGTHEDAYTQFNSRLADLGHSPVTDVRCFATPTEASPGTGGSNPQGHWARCQTLSNQGVIVHMSYKKLGANSWGQVASGAEDQKAQNIGNFLANLPTPGYITWEHEPQGAGTASDFVAGFARQMNIVKALAPAWKTCNVYVGGTFWFNNSGGPEAWWTPGVDVFGIDTYDRRQAPFNGTPWADPNTAFIGVDLIINGKSGRVAPLTFARSKGVPLVIPELGCSVTNPTTDPNYAITQRKWWLDGFYPLMRNLTDVEYINYYERDTSDGNTVNWRITGGTLPSEPQSVQSFWQLSQPSIIPPPPTGPTITSFSPPNGIPGTAVTVLGTGFGVAVTAVRFGGVSTSFTVVSSTRIDTFVPSGAATGSITVVATTGTGTSPTQFVVGSTPPPPFTGAGVVPPMTRVRQAS